MPAWPVQVYNCRAFITAAVIKVIKPTIELCALNYMLSAHSTRYYVEFSCHAQNNKSGTPIP